MPRKPRYYQAGVPCHVITRGNNRSVCFFQPADYQFYLECLLDACKRYHVNLHAYVLMTNHVHLLMTPHDQYGVSRTMQSIGRRYVQYVNYKYRRSGTLWEGRHKASLVDHERYLLICQRYIELNPVRAGMVQQAGDYQWSSYRENAGHQVASQLTPHDCYRRLGVNNQDRQFAYQSLFTQALEEKTLSEMRCAINTSMPIGGVRFKQEIEAAIGRTLGYVKRGKPSKRRPASGKS
jgi:putative transposase